MVKVFETEETIDAEEEERELKEAMEMLDDE